mmetsp:Transcript_19096/g.36514  ORF Transcript_19096/g.36514 Transcript_19096/m.36514 type:complete len:241 (+) Transcript_19096:1407-2129(+)
MRPHGPRRRRGALVEGGGQGLRQKGEICRWDAHGGGAVAASDGRLLIGGAGGGGGAHGANRDPGAERGRHRGRLVRVDVVRVGNLLLRGHRKGQAGGVVVVLLPVVLLGDAHLARVAGGVVGEGADVARRARHARLARLHVARRLVLRGAPARGAVVAGGVAPGALLAVEARLALRLASVRARAGALLLYLLGHGAVFAVGRAGDAGEAALRARAAFRALGALVALVAVLVALPLLAHQG